MGTDSAVLFGVVEATPVGSRYSGVMRTDQPSAPDIASFLKTTCVGLDQQVVGIRPVSDALAGHLSFVSDLAAAKGALENALEVGAIVLVPRDDSVPDARNGTVIPVDRPRFAFAIAVTNFFAPAATPGVAPTAIIHPTAVVSESASIGAFTVIGPGAKVGEGTEIRHHCVLGPNVQIGAHCLLKSHAVIGEEGFGLEADNDGNNVRLPHLGSVQVGNAVEVGSFTSINSGTILPTIIEDFVKISDNVHISHNCRVGENSILTGCVELSGSVTLGKNVWVAPNASVREKLSIGDGAIVGIGAVVTRSIEEGRTHYGNPAREVR